MATVSEKPWCILRFYIKVISTLIFHEKDIAWKFVKTFPKIHFKICERIIYQTSNYESLSI